MAASCAAGADAGFLGFVASQRVVGANTIVDIYAGVSNASDKFLSVYNLNASTSITGGFFQGGTLALKAWKPDSAGFTSTRDSIDSFMTAGTFSGGAYGGVYYASANTNGGPNFTGVTGAWSGTPGSAPATTIPANAGWFTGDPTSVDNNAESLVGLVGRINGTGASAANYGIWCAHLVFASTNVNLGTNVLWNGVGSAKDGVTGATTSATSSFPAVPPVDSDGDGVPDSSDACPAVPGTCANGCPPNACGTCGKTPDINLDGTVNGADLGLLLTGWGACSGTCAADLDRNGTVNGADLSVLLAEWGSCGG